MDISRALAVDLAALSDALGDSDVDLETLLQALAADLKDAIASYIGMTLTIIVNGHEFSFTMFLEANAEAVATSLKIPLAALSSAEEGTSLVLYATMPGAFVDLAADLSYVLGLGPDLLVPDQRTAHHATTLDQAGVAGLAEYSLVNQAVGVLIARGHTAESARDELRRLADLDGGHLRDAASTVLMSVKRGPVD